MKWGYPFQPVHLVTMVIAVALMVGVYFLLRILPERVRYGCLIGLSFLGIVAIIFNLVRWGSPLEYLPFHMCSITAILLPIAVISKNRIVGNLLVVWCLGSLLALIFPTAVQAEYEILSDAFFIFYIPHIFEFAVTVYLFLFGYIKKDFKTIPTTLGITVGIYTLVHFINVGLTHYSEQAGLELSFNYMFSMESPGNPVLDIFWKIIPCAYWYMYMAVVILAVYLVVLYLPQIIRAVKEKKAAVK